MKILFVRHGESVDDVEDRYGGSADFDLTEKGKTQVSETAKKIPSLDGKFEIVLSSPLKRAFQSAEIISNELGLKVKVFEYLKERNLNGVLTGLTRNEAREKYPKVVETHNRWEYVDGSERTEDFNNRVKNAIKYLLETKYNSLVAVTHGLFLKAFFKEFLNIDVKKVRDGGFVLLEEKHGNFMILKKDGIEYELTNSR
ncbi:histidine phosphatase family protein [Patescibacteria group bacterium]|nr:histidine phosphatase family protein [Patescibacteria group bacterium]MBU1886076.1 histidine phosphatase family protein [Patescibacteria group bacterium]